MRVTPECITRLEPNEIFVFGSNLAGRHGRGAARDAHTKFGATYGIGDGPTGRCYAIPTKDEDLRILPLDSIVHYVQQFLRHAKETPEKHFLVTPIGCGLASYTPADIAPLFGSKIPANVSLPASFWAHIQKST